MSTASTIRSARAFKRADYGYGDEQTWGPVTDPRDPRYEPTQDDEDAAEAEQAMRDCEQTLGRAQRALDGWQIDAAIDLMAEAARDLLAVAEAMKGAR